METLNELFLDEDWAYLSDEYIEKCEECGWENTVLTQGNAEDCEYLTTIAIKCCHCDNAVIFSLPVN